jgi:hypothetical protein
MEAKEKMSRKQRLLIIALIAVFVIGMGLALYAANRPAQGSPLPEEGETGSDVAVEEIIESDPLTGEQVEEAGENELNDVTGSAPGSDDGVNESGEIGE